MAYTLSQKQFLSQIFGINLGYIKISDILRCFLGYIVLFTGFLWVCFPAVAQNTEPITLQIYIPHQSPDTDTLLQTAQEQLKEYDIHLVRTISRGDDDLDLSIRDMYHSDNQLLAMRVLQQPVRLERRSSLLEYLTALPLEVIFTPDNETIASDFAVHLLIATSLYRVARCDAAQSIFEIIEAHPYITTLEIYYPGWTDGLQFYRGNCAILQDDYEQAIAYFEQAMTYIPHPALQIDIFVTATDINLAWTYLQVGRIDETFVLLDNLIANSPSVNHPSLLSLRAQFYALVSNFDAAIADIDEAIEIQPDWAGLYRERGDIIMLIYEWDRAEADYNQAIALNPNYADTYYSRGILYYVLAERESALIDFERYLQLDPDGIHAEEAQQNIESIRLELDALNTDD